jgi:signal transduction histidine kinase
MRSMWPTAVVGLLVAGAFSALVQGPLWHQDGYVAAVNTTVSVTFVLTGLWLRREPGQRGVAWMLMVLGPLRSLGFADAWGSSPLVLYALIFGGIDRVFGGWALLRYPNRALRKHQRVFLILLVTWMVCFRTLIAVTSLPQWAGAPASSWWPTLDANLPLNTLISYLDNFGEALFGVAALVLLVLRLVRTTGLDRIVITPVIVSGLVATVAAGASAVTQALTSLQTTPGAIYIAEGCLDLALPLAFLVAATQRTQLLRNLTGLITQISGETDIGVVRGALRKILDDPTLEIVDLSGDSGDLEAADATADPAPWRSADRMVEFIRAEGGSPIAVVLADPALERYRSLFDAAVQTSGLALQTAQIQAQAARDTLEQVRASRTRIIEATDAERRRIERDLHDGVQQHLLGLAAQLTAAVYHTADPVAHEVFLEAREGLKEILAELRDLAHGIHPAVLTQGGLRPALEDVAERLPLPVQLTIPSTRLSPAVEATAYYVACEALANAVKHANASFVTVTVRITGSELTMEMTDDGVGGGAQAPGHGLSNIADRVSAFDGEMTVVSPAGAGTRLEVRIPCG